MKCVNGECVRLEKEICCFDCDKLYDCKKEDAACNNYECKYYGKIRAHTEVKNEKYSFASDTVDFEKWFIDGIDKLKNPNNCLDILNWYRNLYYKFDKNTERGRVAQAINELFMLLKKNNVDLDNLEGETYG